jgi:ubiquinone/menaquinone biosynthesis C-methylase UbiE
MNIHKFYGKFGSYFRKKRMRFFEELLQPHESTKILDVGGSEYNWLLIDIQPEITLLNVSTSENKLNGRFHHVKGDGRKLPYADKSFDIVYSNSVIEHVGTFEDQLAFAREIARVGKSYFVQTPNKNFFIEPHFIAPFIHFFPKWLRIKLARHLTLWGLMTKPSHEAVEEMVNSINLLRQKDLKKLFPDAKFKSEKFLGISKSLLAYKV